MRRQTLKVADHAYLLETGYVVASGPADQLVNDSVVSEAFLGGRSSGRGNAVEPA
jgi:branched-chain amino acid transport system ATP-binding protein